MSGGFQDSLGSGVFSEVGLAIVAEGEKDAGVAGGASGMADRSAVGDEVEVEGEVRSRGHERFDEFVRGVSAHARRDDAQSSEDAVNVGIDGEHVAVEREEGHALRRLGTHAFEAEQLPLDFRSGQPRQMVQGEVAVVPFDLAKEGLDAGAPGPGESRRAQGGLEGFGRGFEHGAPGRKSPAHGFVGSARVYGGGVLGEEGLDELVQGIPGFVAEFRAVAIGLFEGPGHRLQFAPNRARVLGRDSRQAWPLHSAGSLSMNSSHDANT